MEKIESIIKGAGSIALTGIVYFLGGLDVALISLVTVIVIDYVTGMAKSYIKGNLNSQKGFKGIIKKVCMLLVVALAVVADKATVGNGAIRTLVTYYLVANEALSIIENLAAMDIRVPKILIDKLEQLKRTDEDEEKEKGA